LQDIDFCAELSLAIRSDVRCLAKKGRFVVRSAILIFLAILAFAATPAWAQGTWLERSMIRALAGLKSVKPKLQAFYDGLDAKQKKAFDTGGRIGGIFDWWGRR
jgi:hypothetical protein